MILLSLKSSELGTEDEVEAFVQEAIDELKKNHMFKGEELILRVVHQISDPSY